MVKLWDIIINPFDEWQTKVVQIIEMPNMVLYGLEKEELDLSEYNPWPDKVISKSKAVRQPKRGDIVEAKNKAESIWEEVEYYWACEDESIERPHIVVYISRAWERVLMTANHVRQKPIEEPKQEDIILVPDNIKIELFDWNLAINNWKQSLFYSEGIYKVGEQLSEYEVECKLIPIDVKDLEVGGTYYRSASKDFYSIDWVWMYCKYLWNGKYVYWSEDSILVDKLKRSYRYKVVPID